MEWQAKHRRDDRPLLKINQDEDDAKNYCNSSTENLLVTLGQPHCHSNKSPSRQGTTIHVQVLCSYMHITRRRSDNNVEYQPKAIRQVKHFNQTIVSRLQNCVSDHKEDWEAVVLPLTFAYSTEAHRAVSFATSSLIFPSKQLRLATTCSPRKSGTLDTN